MVRQLRGPVFRITYLGSVGHSFPVNFLDSAHDEGLDLGVIFFNDILCGLSLNTEVFSPLR